MNAPEPLSEPKSTKTMTFYHPQHNEVALFEYAAQNDLPLLLKGPTGCGKTRFVEHMAERLNRPLYTVACHDDLTATDLVGRHLVNHEGTYWQDGPLTKAVREGGICYLDEVIEARKDTTVVIHPLADDRRILPIDRTGEIIEAHPDFMLVVSYNPGYQSLIKGLKPSTRQRFVALSFNYPKAQQELEILQNETGIDDETGKLLVSIARKLRKLAEHDLEEGASTRLLVYAANLIKAGLPLKDALKASIAEPLSDDAEIVSSIMDVINAHIPQ